MWLKYLQQIQGGNIKTLARCISLVENEVNGYEELLKLLSRSDKPVIGITGPPGGGKSILTDAIIDDLVNKIKKSGFFV